MIWGRKVQLEGNRGGGDRRFEPGGRVESGLLRFSFLQIGLL